MTITEAMKRLKLFDGIISRQQYKTIRGQILTGNIEAAMRGLDRLIGGGK